MVDKILPGLFRIEVPLPGNPLKALNSYVITGSGRNLIVDTGLNRGECRDSLLGGLRELGVDLRETDFFITHMHADHSGLHSSLTTDSSRSYCSEQDAARISTGGDWEQMRGYARMSGFPESDLLDAIDRHPAHRYGGYGPRDFHIVKDGDTIALGDYSFRCVETPGHTRGHVCLYEPDRKVLISGDHILRDITPNISLWSGDLDPLAEYLASLDKVYELDVELVLPGHRRLITDCKARILELKLHHRARADEVLSILDGESQNAYQVASRMTWDMKYASWEQLAVPQRWFATGEAIAHLRFLEREGAVRRQMSGDKIFFRSER